MNPIATLYNANGTKIVIELLPEYAPNTVNSFIYAASHGYLDHHALERVVPGNWIDMSYTAFGHKEMQYLIPRESELHPEIEPLPSTPGCVCMGGYDNGLASCEFFFPLRDCPDHKGIYPVFGKVIEGMDEIWRLEKVPTEPVTDFPIASVEVNRPVEPQILDHVELELFGVEYPEPVRVETDEMPACWLQYTK